MNYGAIKKTDIANGKGVRVSLFVSGCNNHCKGCFNPETWDFNYGERFTEDTLEEILLALHPDYISGFSVLGGDPIEPQNVECVTEICATVKLTYPNKTIWVYTGYLYEDVLKSYPDILSSVDVLVDGKFIEKEKDITLRFKGSANQRIIDVQESLKTGDVVLVDVDSW